MAERENNGDLPPGEFSHYVLPPAATGDKETHHASCKLICYHAKKGHFFLPRTISRLYPFFVFNLFFLIAAKTDEQQTGKEGRHDRKMGAMDANSTHGRFCGAEWTERSIPEAKKRVAEQLDIVEKASDVLPSPSQASPKNPPTQEA
jgi:hypothetical protein